MRRIATTFTVLAALGAMVAATAGADDKRTYQAELFNGFGLVEGSELRIAGVNAGTVDKLEITEEKRALITFSYGSDFPALNADASCASEPQSLIAEYFLDCLPGQSDDPLEGPIDAAKNKTTVQNDLVNNILREPFKRRFQLILNEFGTALVGNSENLNAAIRAGAPALQELRKVLKILGRQNTTIAQLNVDSDTVFERLNAQREDVVSFIDKAEDIGRVSADRREDLATNFDLLDDFLVELRPTMTRLAELSRQQTPLLTDLGKAAPGLNRLASNLPGFNNASRVSLKGLGRAAAVGQRALTKGRDEIAELETASERAKPAADLVAEFLESLDDPANSVEEDADARDDLSEQPGEADRRVALLNKIVPGGGLSNPGYTGLEGLLNYVYSQTLSLNQFDQLGHALHINIVGAGGESEGGECGHFSPGPDYQVAAMHGGGRTTDPRLALHCVGILGDTQPGINYDLGLPPLDPSACPDGSTNLAICDPTPRRRSAVNRANTGQAAAPTGDSAIINQLKQGTKTELSPKEIRELLGLPKDVKLPAGLDQGIDLSQSNQSTTDLLNFLFGS